MGVATLLLVLATPPWTVATSWYSEAPLEALVPEGWGGGGSDNMMLYMYIRIYTCTHCISHSQYMCVMYWCDTFACYKLVGKKKRFL